VLHTFSVCTLVVTSKDQNYYFLFVLICFYKLNGLFFFHSHMKTTLLGKVFVLIHLYPASPNANCSGCYVKKRYTKWFCCNAEIIFCGFEHRYFQWLSWLIWEQLNTRVLVDMRTVEYQSVFPKTRETKCNN